MSVEFYVVVLFPGLEKAVGIKGLTLDGIIFNKLDFTNEESKAYSPKIDR